MTTRSLNELSKAVMEKLAILDANSSPSAADHKMIVDRYTELMAGLQDEEIAYWDIDAIPLLVFGAVTDLVALHSGGAFGRPLVALTDIEAAEVPIKRRIKRHTRKHASGEEIRQDNY